MKTTRSTNKFLAPIQAALATPFTPGRGSGCGRVYVELTLAKGESRAVKAACDQLGVIFQATGHYGTRNAIYIGYDNSDGRALAKGEAVANALTAAGIPAYMSAHED